MPSTDTRRGDPMKMTRESFQRFSRFITEQLGIKMSEAKIPMLQSRLMRRLRDLRLGSLEQYQDYLFNSPNAGTELLSFIDAVTTNKTDFFREPTHFDYLVQTALPALNRMHGGSAAWRFKLWCAGCSSGEEPYTQAIVLSEHTKSHAGFDFALLATDVSTRVLEHARTGIYEESRLDPMPTALRHEYFLKGKDSRRNQVRVKRKLRSKVTFHRLNFMDADYRVKDHFDAIFFRNVMIYFDKPTQEAVINKLCRNLVPGGYLFVGHSESLADLNIPVDNVGSAIFRKPL